MENPTAPAAARLPQDIALDLLKFIVTAANVVKGGSHSTAGFAPASAAKNDDQVEQLFDLYNRCRRAVEDEA